MTHIDKNSIKHFSVCFLLSLIGGYGVAFALGCAITKERDDKRYYGHFCWWDIAFDLLGCSFGYLVHWLIFK